jgi:hypothetical protein
MAIFWTMGFFAYPDNRDSRSSHYPSRKAEPRLAVIPVDFPLPKVQKELHFLIDRIRQSIYRYLIKSGSVHQ